MYYGEKLNSITHLIGAVLAVVGFSVSLTISIQQYSWQIITSFTIFGLNLILLYTIYAISQLSLT